MPEGIGAKIGDVNLQRAPSMFTVKAVTRPNDFAFHSTPSQREC